MIRPSGFRGVAFTTAAEGDARGDLRALRRVADRLQIARDWAMARQVHGAGVMRAEGPGLLGEADGLFTVRPGLPVSVATADCVPLVLEAERAVGVAHAGWRGMAAGVVEALREAMDRSGHPVLRAAIGPAIGPCCYEVGPEVSELFGGHRERTIWGAPSVDLWGAAQDRLPGVAVWRADSCTHCGEGLFSYRREGSGARQVAVGWIPA